MYVLRSPSGCGAEHRMIFLVLPLRRCAINGKLGWKRNQSARASLPISMRHWQRTSNVYVRVASGPMAIRTSPINLNLTWTIWRSWCESDAAYGFWWFGRLRRSMTFGASSGKSSRALSSTFSMIAHEQGRWYSKAFVILFVALCMSFFFYNWIIFHMPMQRYLKLYDAWCVSGQAASCAFRIIYSVV